MKGRIIKFRGKRLDNWLWVDGDLVTSLTPKGSMTKFPAIHTTYGTIGTFFIQPETVGQFVGLYDRNEKEVYEHDYISINYKYEHITNGGTIPDQDCICDGEVVYMDSFACFGLRLYKAEYPISEELKECPYLTIPLFQFDLDGDSIEILGNTFDNPEFLKEREYENERNN